jgi:hypothetical protein
MFRPVVSPIAVPRPAASCSPPALRPHLSRAAPHRTAPVQTKVGCRIWAFLLVAACTRRVALSFERKIDSAELHFHSDRATEFRKLTVQLRCRIENRRHICCPWANVEKVAKNGTTIVWYVQCSCRQQGGWSINVGRLPWSPQVWRMN